MFEIEASMTLAYFQTTFPLFHINNGLHVGQAWENQSIKNLPDIKNFLEKGQAVFSRWTLSQMSLFYNCTLLSSPHLF